jgi:type IV pilus assembly protein PilC
MATFTYTARAFNGDLRTATIDAASRDDVIAQLRKQRLSVVKIDQDAAKSIGRGAIKTRDVVIFTRQFSTMINSGLPLVQALTILAEQSENKTLSEITRKVVFDVESGNTVADAMGKHPAAFSPLYVNMVAAGEAGGILDTILMRLATFMEKNDALVRKVKGAMIYPSVIMSVAAVAVTVLLIFVIPVFENLFSSAGLALPLPTRIVMGASRFLKGYWYMMIAGVVTAWFLYKRYVSKPDGRLKVDRILLNVPVLGDVLRKSAVSRFTRTLGTLVSSGVSILDGLEITAKTAGNRVVQDAIMESRSSIAGGDTIAQPLKKSGVFPPMVTSKIADFYDDEVDAAVGNLLSLLEPMMIVFLGVVVGGMVVSMYLPIFDMINAVQ